MNNFDEYDDRPTGIFHQKSRFSKAISSVLISVMLMQHGAILADVIKQNAQQGESLAHELNSQDFMPTINNGELTFPSSGQGNSLQFNMNELYPGTSSSNQRPSSYYFPDTGMSDVDSLKDSFDSSISTGNIGNTATQALGADSRSDNPSIGGMVYQIVEGAAHEPARDWTDDPMFVQSLEVYENMDIISKEFAECTETTSFNQTEFDASSPDYQRCERLNKPKGNCRIDHEIETKYSSFHIYVAAPGRTWLTVEFDLKNGSHKRIGPSDGDTYRANVPTIDYDAVCANSLVSEGKVLGTWDWVAHGFGGSVDTTVWYRVLEVPSCENGLVGKVQIQDTTQSSSTEHVLGGHFGLSVVSLVGDSWGTDECIEDYKMKDTNFCNSPEITIFDSTNSNGCKAIYDTSICEGGPIYSALENPPHEDFTKFTDRVDIGTFQCDFNKGPMDCFIDTNGIEQCPYNEGNIDNSCVEFEQDSSCGFIKSVCLDGATDEEGNCLVFEDTYDCGFTAKIPTLEADTKYECAGPIRCMGEDCVNPEREQSLDFARVSALLNAAETIGQDANCLTSAENTGSDHDIDVVCSIFGGEEQTCKKAVGGVQNCCETPKGISLTDYVSLIMGVKKMNTAIMGIEAGSNLSFIKSGYETLTSPITGAYDVISKPFTGLIDNIKGVTDTISSTITDLTDIIKDKIADMFNTVFQTTAQNTGATAAIGAGATEGTEQLARSAGEQIVSGAGTALSVIGTVYTIYAVTMLAIQMIFKCTEDELELNVNRVLKNTHHIGSYCHKKVLGVCIEKREAYCVFKSPLSRILQEQVRGQLGMTFGDPENPSCDGLAIEQLGAIDWDLVNLDEWLAILSETGNLKDMNIDMESLTGSGSSMNLGSRDDATERTLERFQDIDTEQIRRDSTNLQGAPVFTP